MRRFLGVCAFGIALGLGNAHAETPLPKGWSLAGSNPASYTVQLDGELKKAGMQSARLEAPNKTEGFGTLMQSILADPYRGKRLQLSAFIKTSEVLEHAGLWMRVDGPSHIVVLDNMNDRPITGTIGWNKFKVVLDVPANASAIAFGVLLDGAGKVWIDDVNLSVVGDDVPVTASPRLRGAQELVASPTNLDFEI
nr:hypothetical protein [Oceanococcus sp. HetDA_MAG_MS8]